MIAQLTTNAAGHDLSSVQVVAFAGLAALGGAVAGDLLFGRHDRIRARRAEARAARLQRHVEVLEARSSVRPTDTRRSA